MINRLYLFVLVPHLYFSNFQLNIIVLFTNIDYVQIVELS